MSTQDVHSPAPASESVTHDSASESVTHDTEQRLRALFEQRMVGVSETDTAGRIAAVNDRFCEITGYSRAELLAMDDPVERLTYPEDLSESRATVRRLLHGELDSVQLEKRYRRKGGRTIWANVTISPIRNAAGRPERLLAVIEEITERKRTEAALQAELADNRRLQELSTRLIPAEAPETLYEELVTAAVDLMGADRGTLQLLDEQTGELRMLATRGIPKQLRDKFACFSPESAATSCAEAVRRGKRVVIEDCTTDERVAGTEETRVLLEAGIRAAQSTPLVSRSGRVLGMISTHWNRPHRMVPRQLTLLDILARQAADLIERRQAEDALRDSERRLQRLNENLEQRVAERTAVANQRAEHLRALSGELTQAEQRERHRLAQVLHDHLQQILVAAKMQTGMLNGAEGGAAQRAAAQLTTMLDEAIDSSRNLSHELSPQVLYDAGLAAALKWLAPRKRNEHGLTVHVETEEAVEPGSEEVRIFLFQAVRELLLNIVKHAETQEAWVRMSRAEGDRLRIEVEDRGRGFDPAPDNREEGGDQLGLFGVRERLQLLGGEMRIDSALGAGTRITILAPVHGDQSEPRNRPSASAPAPDRPGPARAPETEPGNSPAAGPRHDRPIRVLLADDHKIVREGLAQMLEQEPDLELVGQAADGKQALELAERLEPNVVVLDVAMPGLGGVEAAERIRQRTPETVVIALSMHEPEAMAEAMREAGASAYLSKQSAPAELVSTIRRHGGGQPQP